MAASFPGLFTTEDIEYINQLPAVQVAREKLDAYTASGMVYFSIPLTESIRSALEGRFGLSLSGTSSIPMRWIKGDTMPHVDVGQGSFENTYMAYMSDSPGELIVDGSSYPISTNRAYMFNEGVNHETIGTGVEPRLLIGPMNERALPVGAPVAYYATEADALAFTNALGYSLYTVGDGGPFGPGGGYQYWRIASNSTGTSSQAIVYANGSILNNDGGYNLYPATPCFLEGTKILCKVDGVEKYVPVEKLEKGTLVKTSRDGFKTVVLVGKGSIQNPGTDERNENRLYKCSAALYSDLEEDLYITGCHSILVDSLTDAEKKETTKRLGKLFITDHKYRLMACVDARAEPWAKKGTYPIWHFALEHEDDGANYGVYANGKLLVETCSIRSLKARSNLTVS